MFNCDYYFIYLIYIYSKLINIKFILFIKFYNGDWGLGIGDWGLGIGPIPNPQSPIPNPQSPK